MEHAGDRPSGEDRRAAANNQALETLRWHWGVAYTIDHDDEHGWRASRRDGIGGLLTAGGPDELRQVISDDYIARPVPREPETTQ
jgi:hypothetical protein